MGGSHKGGFQKVVLADVPLGPCTEIASQKSCPAVPPFSDSVNSSAVICS